MYMPLITAHSGCENSADNTVSSIRTGVAAGAHSVEIDVRCTSDEKLILMHDAEIPTHSRGVVRVSDVTFPELLELQEQEELLFKHPHMEITLLETALELAASREIMLNIDVKDNASAESVVPTVKRHDMEHQVVLSGCDAVRARRIRSAHPQMQVLLNAELPPRSSDGAVDRARDVCRDATDAGCCGINIDFRQCSRELVSAAQLRYLPVSVWTVDSPEDMREMMELGVFAITTYHPSRLLSLIAG